MNFLKSLIEKIIRFFKRDKPKKRSQKERQHAPDGHEPKGDHPDVPAEKVTDNK